jgi:hypothetical protein
LDSLAKKFFRSKATVYGAASKLRGIAEFLVREVVWLQNLLRWMQGPKIDSRSHLPKRINPEAMNAIWKKAISRGIQNLGSGEEDQSITTLRSRH